jgi:hypothetical protein
MSRQRLITFLKFAVGIGLIILLFTRLQDPVQLWRQMVDANKWLLALGALCYSAAVALSGLKWGVLLRAVGIDTPTLRLLSYQWQAEFFNAFLPAQVGGDVVRGYAVAAETHRNADAAASVVIDRFIGLLVFMAFSMLFSYAMLLWGRPDGAQFTAEQLFVMRAIAFGSTLFTLALLVALAAMFSRRLKSLIERLFTWLPFSNRTTPIWRSASQAFDRYRHQYRALIIVALSSILIVVLTSINIWLIAAAIQPGEISLREVLFINPIIVFIGLALPLSPGGLGVRQGAFVATFLLMGADAALGFAVGLMQQFIGYLVSLPGGVLWMRSGRHQEAKSSPTGSPSPAPPPHV